MDIIYGYPDIERSRKNYIALGNFDGVHIGHKKIIRNLKAAAEKKGARSIVVSFEDHPRTILTPCRGSFLLTPSPTKALLISELGIDMLVFLPFDKDFSEVSPFEFVRDVLVRYFHPSEVYVGYNYSFGCNREGTPEMLEQFGKFCGFYVNVVPAVCVGGKLVSSSYIRDLLDRGDIQEAKEFLGHWPFYQGRVVAGDNLGHTLGYPTANLHIPEQVKLPRCGVYFGKAYLEDCVFNAVVNIGVRPTVNDRGDQRFEVHLLEFRGQIYGKELTFSFRKFLREERQFSSREDLKKQISKDVEQVRGIISRETGASKETLDCPTLNVSE